MFPGHQLISTCFAIMVFGSTSVAVAADKRTNEDASSVAVWKRGAAAEISDLQPFTHIAYLPVGADLSSIQFEGIKAVNVYTKRQSRTNEQFCAKRLGAEGESALDCPHTAYKSPVPAYQVSYSFQSQPMVSDESGSIYFTFSVYFRTDELDSGLSRALSSGKLSRTAAAEFFRLTTSRDSVQQTVIDQAHSTFCEGNYVDGNWTHTDPKCNDNVGYREAISASSYITVEVDSVLHPAKSVAASGSWPK
jgi:hypothetical protein